MKNKIIWTKPDYKNEFGRVSEKEIDKMCIERTESGDVKIEREQYGRKIRFFVFRLEKVGEQVEGIETLSRQRAIEELKERSHLKNETKKKRK